MTDGSAPSSVPTSFLHHIANTSGPARGYEILHYRIAINDQHLFDHATSATDATVVPANPFTLALTQPTTIAAVRNARRAGVPQGVVAILHPGPRTMGVVCVVVAAWLPSNAGTIRTHGDITNYFPSHTFTMGSTIEVPPEGYRVPIPEAMDLPCWSAQNAAHPLLHIFVEQHTVTGGARASTGHFVEVELQGRINTFGGF